MSRLDEDLDRDSEELVRVQESVSRMKTTWRGPVSAGLGCGEEEKKNKRERGRGLRCCCWPGLLAAWLHGARGRRDSWAAGRAQCWAAAQ